MIQRSVSFNTTCILRFILLISVALTSACENEEITRPQTKTEPPESPLPVREWYPAPKHRQQPTVYVPVPVQQQQPVMAPSGYQGNIVQQPWGTTAQQPVYSTPQPVYPSQPPVNQYQQPSVWAGQQPGVTQYQFQHSPRPWGNVTEPNRNQNSAGSTDAWPQGGYYSAPWGSNQSGAAAGHPGQVPGTVFYDYQW